VDSVVEPFQKEVVLRRRQMAMTSGLFSRMTNGNGRAVHYMREVWEDNELFRGQSRQMRQSRHAAQGSRCFIAVIVILSAKDLPFQYQDTISQRSGKWARHFSEGGSFPGK